MLDYTRAAHTPFSDFLSEKLGLLHKRELSILSRDLYNRVTSFNDSDRLETYTPRDSDVDLRVQKILVLIRDYLEIEELF